MTSSPSNDVGGAAVVGRPITTIEPTNKAELTIMGILVFTGLMSIALLCALIFGHLGDPAAKYVGIGFWISLGAMVVGLLIFITSRCGSHVRVAAMGGEVDIGGTDRQ